MSEFSAIEHRLLFHPFEPVKSAPLGWKKQDLIDHVRTAMAVELGTLPIYFCALYSIHQDNGGIGSKARAHILSIAEQEMLHLALAGNMLCALDGKQLLYSQAFMPTYPSEILFDKIRMQLAPANKDNLECFLKIEAPYLPPPVPPKEPVFLETNLLETRAAVAPKQEFIPEYRSIGQFYENLEKGLRELAPHDPGLFSKNTSKQLRGSEFFDSKMTIITDQETALEALTTIVDQGEGSIGIPDSHYSIFVDLYQQHKQWVCVNYVEDPSTISYKDVNNVAYRLSLAVDASYCLLLQTLDRCWQGDIAEGPKRKQLLRNIHQLMVAVLSPTAHVLVQQKIGSQFAAPCFEFYPQGEKTPLKPQPLYEALKKEIETAQKEATRAGDKNTADAIGRIAFCLSNFNVVADE
ncbi:ferritin-like-domain-containing protein [Trametes gibbosa]|nr:ferritin-like-domain-containing protein [Trametes gibbosa]